jgi:hypothetical protein
MFVVIKNQQIKNEIHKHVYLETYLQRNYSGNHSKGAY